MSDLLLATSLEEVTDALRGVADPDKAEPMAAYTKYRFNYLGVSAGDRRNVAKDWTKAAKHTDADELVDFASLLWTSPFREVHYVGMDAIRAGAQALSAEHLPAVRALIEATPWWDTVDSLAIHTVGPMVRNHAALEAVMDEWVHDPNLWIVRTAILHQLMYKESIDAERLFGYCEIHAEHSNFFIRKAIGWALRQHARIAPGDVREFVELQRDRFSGLTVREALKHLG